ncbi:MAG: MinD/ParA family protein [Rhodospirillales bacterium]|nr:MinD/ParA family protein [Rhodospirillales bacterium]
MIRMPTAHAQAVPRARGSNVVAIASGKGGVGKTWFAITLAHALARRGGRTLLFDADIGLANVDIQLGVTPKHDLGGVLTGRLTLNQAAVTFKETGFDIIAGRSGSGSLANIPASRVQLLSEDLVMLASSYDRVIVDLGAGVERTVRQFTHNVGMCLVLTTDEPTALTDAYAFIKLTHLERPGTDIRIVVNMVNSTREGERTYKTLLKACEGFLKFSPPMLGLIRHDNKVREAIRNQTSILTLYPNSEAGTDVESIAEKLLG